MMVTDWWERIEEFTRAGDWNGVLVAADAMEELGETLVAHGLRWAIEKGWQPKLDVPNRLWVVQTTSTGPLREIKQQTYYDYKREGNWPSGLYWAWLWIIQQKGVVPE